jgi:hypothetical protein
MHLVKSLHEDLRTFCGEFVIDALSLAPLYSACHLYKEVTYGYEKPRPSPGGRLTGWSDTTFPLVPSAYTNRPENWLGAWVWVLMGFPGQRLYSRNAPSNTCPGTFLFIMRTSR